MQQGSSLQHLRRAWPGSPRTPTPCCPPHTTHHKPRSSSPQPVSATLHPPPTNHKTSAIELAACNRLAACCAPNKDSRHAVCCAPSTAHHAPPTAHHAPAAVTHGPCQPRACAKDADSDGRRRLGRKEATRTEVGDSDGGRRLGRKEATRTEGGDSDGRRRLGRKEATRTEVGDSDGGRRLGRR